jgi:hypothetical protein
VVVAVALVALIVVAAPGSVRIIERAPASSSGAAAVPGWARPCVGAPIVSLRQGFCARVDGRVMGSQTKSNGETHLLVLGGFHATLVEVERGDKLPGWGSRIVAIGPIIGSSAGLREVRAVSLAGG